ncbi:MAG: hypothetical protein OEV42_05985 [Deltaproteobacteria bacterium]|nr:hypothetical protein [Deltaproteobacteria bacterium]
MRNVLLMLLLLMPSISVSEAKSRHYPPHFNAASHQYDDWAGIMMNNGVYPLGFSKDGWLAYTSKKTDYEFNKKLKMCNTPPCYDARLINISCDPECYSDTPTQKGDNCYCRSGLSTKDLENHAIKAISKYLGGKFPAKVNSGQYDMVIKVNAGEQVSISGENVFKSWAEVWITSKEKGEKRLGVIHDHNTSYPETTRPMGWLQDPFHNRLVVIAGYVVEKDESNKPIRVEYKLFGADLNSGFTK